jgi:hypothetical protein
MKERTERSQSFKANLEADLRHCELAFREQLFGAFDPFAGEIFMWCSMKGAAEGPQELIAREICVSCQFV